MIYFHVAGWADGVEAFEASAAVLAAVTIPVAIIAFLGAGLAWWGWQDMRAAKLHAALVGAFERAGAANIVSAGTGHVGDPFVGARAYGVWLGDGEQIVATLLDDDAEVLCNNRGQVAAVTDRRLLYVLPRPAGGSKAPEDTYTIESVLLEDVTQLWQKHRFAIGGLFAGIGGLTIGVGVGVGTLSGSLAGPGAASIALMMTLVGLGLVSGVRRRVIAFDTEYGRLHWWSGPMEIARTGPRASKVGQFFKSRRTPSHGFDVVASSSKKGT